MVWEVKALGLEILPKQRVSELQMKQKVIGAESQRNWGRERETVYARDTLGPAFQGDFTLGVSVTQTHYISVSGILQTAAHTRVPQKNFELRPT